MTLAPPAPAAPQAPAPALAPLLLPPGLRLTPGAVRAGVRGQPRGGAGTGGRWPTDRDDTHRRRDRRSHLQPEPGLGLAARRCSLPLQLFDSSTGFRLADGSVLSPDLAIELASASDSGPRGAEALRRKMALYQANGALLGWLLVPEQRAVEIWAS